jgi:hypothetical protein
LKGEEIIESAEVKDPLTFASLPTEICLQIWSYAAQVRQVVGLTAEFYSPYLIGKSVWFPPLLINQEAKNKALEFKIDIHYPFANESQTDRPNILTNLEKDINLTVYRLS